ncbi:ATP-binding cassette domain-containing protein [Streptomyces qinzhouensis]|uniref:ATP-binding cassette domain-containing protein n=1 Tax=Streptomyces qinzhouensis TaxID=2599401 RepID=A0A5B8JEN7_9ACTN|nr:ATP-binding cassette domain-containing protein [Streptomyces qinzhouensis]QDY80077.1 ATP-binding cassette domain-containing protein [Streptomyces qinzhouensis]
MTSIDVVGMTKQYGAKRALDGVTFSVRPGRVTGFLGPNGAGKSTAMRLMVGLDRPTSGTATIGGSAYASLADPLRTVGALLDPQAALGSRTARAHVKILAAAGRIPARRVEEVLEQAGIASVAGRRIKTYSLGMRQRLGIATALLGDPEVLLLDEPSNGLDPEGITWIRELMRSLAAEGRTVLVSSHLMGETSAFADHLVVLGKGRLLADTPLGEFVSAWTVPRVWLRTADAERTRSALAAEGLTFSGSGDGRWTVEGADLAGIGALAAREGLSVLELAAEEPSLEDAYLALTAGETEFTAVAPRTETPEASS